MRGPKSSPVFVSPASSMEQRTEGCAEIHEPAELTERDGGEAGNAGKKALRNAVRRALLCCQCRYRGNTIQFASIGEIAHKDTIRVFTCPWDLLRLVAVTWNGSLFPVLSHLCVLFLCCDLRFTNCVGDIGLVLWRRELLCRGEDGKDSPQWRVSKC